MVVMAIIPFGLIGTIYGHAAWGVPLSMFTVVGLLGMTGIIINDSIVLVTTIDEYAEDRGLVPSIIDGASDRLRPVMLTTLTTVLGMTPLLYEQSQQAQFLMPTVITLVYGLGFGMLLVLLVVPALIAAQHDVSRQITAMRRGVGARANGLAWSLRGLWLVILAWGGVTLGYTIGFGTLPDQITTQVPMLANVSPMISALGLFIAGCAILVLAAYIILALAFQWSARRKQQQV
jgi:predicted RND superfamily exporter protein